MTIRYPRVKNYHETLCEECDRSSEVVIVIGNRRVALCKKCAKKLKESLERW